VEEPLLDDVGLVAETQDKISMAVVAVVLHHVPKNWMMPNRHHRLGHILGVVANPGSQTATEQNDLHVQLLRGTHPTVERCGTIAPSARKASPPPPRPQPRRPSSPPCRHAEVRDRPGRRCQAAAAMPSKRAQPGIARAATTHPRRQNRRIAPRRSASPRR